MPRLWTCLALLLIGHGPLAAAPTAAIVDDTVVVHGVAPGAELVIMGAGQRLDDWVPVVLADRGRTTDENGDGTARYTPPFPIPKQSVWVVVDLTDGGIALAAPAGTPVREMLVRRGRRSDSALAVAGQRVDVAVVRPGVGAWTAAIGDGGETDGDGRGDGMLTVSAAGMTRLEGSSAGATSTETLATPAGFEADDIVVLIDPRSLQIAALRMGELGLSSQEEGR